MRYREKALAINSASRVAIKLEPAARGAGTELATAEPHIKSIEEDIGERLQSHARK
jgi:hypothetical protein